MNKTSHQWLMQQSKPASRWLFISILIGVLSGISIIIQSDLLAIIIDKTYLHHAKLGILMPLLIACLCTMLIRAILSFLKERIHFRSAKIVKTSIRQYIFHYLMSLTPDALTQFKTGSLTSTLTEQIEALHDFYADYLPQMSIAVLLPLIILATVFKQNWIAGLILLITAPLIPIFMALIGMQTAKLNQDSFQTLAKMSAHFLDILQGLPTLSLFNQANSQTSGIESVSEKFREKTMRVLYIAFLSSAALELFSTLSIALIAVYLGLSLLGLVHTPITLHHALFILLLAPAFFNPLRQLGVFYHAKTKALGAADEILKIINDNKSTNITGTDHLHKNKDTALIFENLAFQYHLNKKVISQLNLSIKPNQCIAITGESGSGKSTLLYLIAKLRTPTYGKILANNQDIQTLDNDNWRSHIGFLHQNPRLFCDTIAENIRFGSQKATINDIENAAEQAGVMAFAKNLPNKLDTVINENNAGLSGGQIQRIALARIILKDAPLVLLDEPTAYLDEKNKQIIIDLIKTWKDKKTIIIATHDTTLIKSADNWYDMETLS